MKNDTKSMPMPATPAILTCLALAASTLPLGAATVVPAAIAAGAGETLIAVIHAEGAQIYECESDGAATMNWRFREPVATLLDGGRTAGRHYAGPSWAFDDGSTVAAVVVARAPGARGGDIPLLKLEVTARSGSGPLAAATTIQRLDTRGGLAEGPCTTVGAYLSVPYSADYAFYGPAQAGKTSSRWSPGPYDYLFGGSDAQSADNASYGPAQAGTSSSRWSPGPYDYLFGEFDAQSAGQALTAIRREARPESAQR